MLLAVAVVSVAAGVAGGAKKPVRCATSGHTIAKNRHVRVFRVGSPDFYSAYACVLPRGRVRHLGDYENDGGGEWDGVYGFQLAGDFVAYEDAICDRTDCTGSIKSFNVVTREMAHRARIPIGETSRFYVLVLNRHGSVAWTRPSTVWKCDAPKCVLLDRNRRSSQTWIRPYSLTLRGHVLRWTHHDGAAYSAPLK
jgi:hypothetical protein